MKRTVETEWLDELPANDPGALGSRRDIRRLNWVMGNAGILHRLLRPESRQPAPKRIVELGAGDGLFMLELAKYLAPSWKNIEVVLVDGKPAFIEEARCGLNALGWTVEAVVADVFDWLKQPADGLADVMVANLFLHQFSDEQLTKMLGLVSARTKLFAACEPRRGLSNLFMSHTVGLIGCNAVSRHDAPVSVHAGFTGQELCALWPANGARLDTRTKRESSPSPREERAGRGPGRGAALKHTKDDKITPLHNPLPINPSWGEGTGLQPPLVPVSTCAPAIGNWRLRERPAQFFNQTFLAEREA